MRQVPCKHYKEKAYKEFKGLEIFLRFCDINSNYGAKTASQFSTLSLVIYFMEQISQVVQAKRMPLYTSFR